MAAFALKTFVEGAHGSVAAAVTSKAAFSIHQTVDSAAQVAPTIYDVRTVRQRDRFGHELGTPGLDQSAGAGVAHGRDGVPPVAVDEEALEAFEQEAVAQLELPLALNGTFAAYADTYSGLGGEDGVVANGEESVLRELHTFAHHKWTKGLRVVSVDWHARTSRVVAISTMEPGSFTERLAMSRAVHTYFAIIWNFNDPIHPQLVLESPSEVACLRFNPSPALSHFVIGGLLSGQVILWDLRPAEAVRAAARKANGDAVSAPPSTTGGPAAPQGLASGMRAGGVDHAAGDDGIIRVPWTQLSKVEAGQRRAVVAVAWLKDGLECGFDGRLAPSSEEGAQYQFASTASDGLLLIWDIRKLNMRRDKLRKLQAAARSMGPGGSSAPDAAELPWMPLIKVPLVRPDGGDVACTAMFLEGKLDPYRIVLGSEEGELLVASWRPEEDRKDPLAAELGTNPEGQRRASAVRSGVHAHFGAVVAVERHPNPQLADVYLTVGDHSFRVWKLDVAEPLIVSPQHNCALRCACWSPTRAMLLFVGTEEGQVQIWDLLDRAHEPVAVHAVSQGAIACLSIRAPEGHRARSGTQLLAAGDDQGILHLYEVPPVLARGGATEAKALRRALEREHRRVDYFRTRWTVRQRELEERKARQQTERADADLVSPAPAAVAVAGGKGDLSPLGALEEAAGGADAAGANEFLDPIKFEEAREAYLELVAKLDEADPLPAA